MVAARGGSAETVRKQFSNPESLSQRLVELEPQLTVEGRDGVDNQEITLAALERIARELLGDPKEQSGTLFERKS